LPGLGVTDRRVALYGTSDRLRWSLVFDEPPSQVPAHSTLERLNAVECLEGDLSLRFEPLLEGQDPPELFTRIAELAGRDGLEEDDDPRHRMAAVSEALHRKLELLFRTRPPTVPEHEDEVVDLLEFLADFLTSERHTRFPSERDEEHASRNGVGLVEGMNCSAERPSFVHENPSEWGEFTRRPRSGSGARFK
jgi:hypothetical protein